MRALRALRVLVSAAGWALLGALALAGLGIAAGVLGAALPATRPVVAGALIRYVDAAVAGRLSLEGVDVLPGGAFAIQGLKAYDPDGQLVLQVDRLLVSADVTRLRNKVVGLEVELTGAAVMVDEDGEGRLSLARAFAPAHPSTAPKKETTWEDLGGWTVRLRKLTVRDAAVWWQDRGRTTRVELQEVSIDGRAIAGPRRVRAELSLKGQAYAPLEGPVSLEVRALLDGDQLRVPVLGAQLAGTGLAGVAELDLAKRSGRAALTKATLDRSQARTLVQGTPPGADLALQAYAESDGKVATAAVHLEPRGAGGPGARGGGDASAAVRLDGTRALGFDVAARELDPSALHAQAPAGSVTLAARGGLSGESLTRARGSLVLDLARSRLRGAELGPAAATVRLDRGSYEAPRLSLSAPGLRLAGSGSWQRGGAAAAQLTGEVDDLARALDNAGKLLGLQLPRLSGRGKVEANLAGTAAAPVLGAKVAAPVLAYGGTSVAGVEAKLGASGPFEPGRLELEAKIDRLEAGGKLVARELALTGGLSPAANEAGAAACQLTASGLVPSIGTDPVTVEAAGTLTAARDALRLSALALGYPGTRYELTGPARLTFAGPRVDRLELAAGSRRLALSGGIGPRQALDARLEVERLDLTRLPAGLLPDGLGIAGDLTADARAAGTLARPEVEASLRLAGAGYRTERDDALQGKVRWNGGARRAAAELTLTRGKGGTVELSGELPLPLRGRPSEPIAATVRAADLPVGAILDLAGQELPLAGKVGGTVQLTGTVGSPAIHAVLSVAEGSYQDLRAVGVEATADVTGVAEARADVQLAGRPSARLTARAPLSAAALLDDPAAALRRLRDARLSADLALPGLELADLSGRLRVPEGLRGRVTGEAHLTGRIDAPRGTVDLALADGAYDGYAGLSGTASAVARDDRVDLRAEARLGDQGPARLTAALAAPVERLAGQGGLRAAGLSADLVVPAVDLGRAATTIGAALGGTMEARLRAGGTVAHPELQLEAAGRAVSLRSRLLGELKVSARSAGERATAELTLEPPTGGTLTASAAVQVAVTPWLGAAELRRAPAEVTARATGLDLALLAALAPSYVRSASGKLEAEVSASGPLSRLTPRGSARLADGRISTMEYGEWKGIALDGSMTLDAIELRRLEARRGPGSVVARGSLRGLTGEVASLEGKLEARSVNLSRAGMELATATFDLNARGSYRDRHLDARLDLPSGLLVLPDKLPRNLQSLDPRKDIIVGKLPPAKAAKAAPADELKPIRYTVRLVSPGGFNVRRENPRIRLELKADATYELQGASDYMTGSVEVVRGTVEPLSDRRFEVKRGRVLFTGGPPRAAMLDVEAFWENSTADVTVTVTGALTKPDISLRSNPALDEGQIAMLIATGQTDLRAGGGATTGTNKTDPSRAAAQKLGFAVFNTFIRDQLPFTAGDLSVDASAARVSGYVPGTKIYVGYTRRFDAIREQGENEDEVRLEYAITPHWTLQGTWGSANTGGASLIWSKDY